MTTSALPYQYAGADWLTKQLDYVGRPAPSALGRVVADILGEVWAGLYHLADSALFHSRTEWSNERVITVTVGGELANHDSPKLTWLVLLAHAHGVRVAISGASRGFVRLQFSSGADQMYLGAVPALDQIIARFRERYPEGAR